MQVSVSKHQLCKLEGVQSEELDIKKITIKVLCMDGHDIYFENEINFTERKRLQNTEQ